LYFYNRASIFFYYQALVVLLLKRLKILSFFIFCVAVSLTIVYVISKEPEWVATSTGIDLGKTIIIDAGHGGYDGGAVAEDGTPEKDINLCIAKDLKAFLELFDYNVVMTRDSDKSTESDNGKNSWKTSDLFNRLQLMSRYNDAIFVSIHLNKFTSTNVSGAQTFYSQKSENSEQLANSIHSKIISMLQPDNTREVKKGTNSIYLLRNATCPAVIVECGFISNREELEKLKTEKYQRMMAFCIFCGIMDYNNTLRL
jgi:N-acetylmuramoyl-L-alanine amidase